VLMNRGFAVTDFAYPYGEGYKNSTVRSMIQDCGYNSARRAWGLNGICTTCPYAESIPPFDFWGIKTTDNATSDMTLDTLESFVTNAENGGGWVTLVFHEICDGCDQYSITQANLEALLDWLQPRAARGTVVNTINDVIGGSVQPSPGTADQTPPSSSISCNGSACSSDSYQDPVQVTLAATDDSSGVEAIRYTTDGSTPTLASPVYTGPFTVSTTTTVKYRAWDNAGNAEATHSQLITIGPPAPQITATDPSSPANDNNPEVKGTASAEAVQINLYKDDPSCTDPPAATDSKSSFEGAGITVAVAGDHTTQLRARAVDQAGNASPCSDPFAYTEDSTPPETTFDSGPSGGTNDPTPTFTFHASEAGSTFQCSRDGGAYFACTSGWTTAHLADGQHTFAVRATDPAHNTDPTPAARSFTVRTAAVSVSGSTLVVTAATGAKDNLVISSPSASVLRVTDFLNGAYSGSGVHTGIGCTQSGDSTVICSSAGITLIQVSSKDQTDKVLNSTAIPGSLNGGAAEDVLVGGSNNDTLTGGPGAVVMKGMNGNDQLFARDLTSDTTINCDGGTTPSNADKVDLDLLPNDSSPLGCETVTRH
jgi:hypothetical protein